MFLEKYNSFALFTWYVCIPNKPPLFHFSLAPLALKGADLVAVFVFFFRQIPDAGVT